MTVDENHRGTTPDVVVDETHGRSHTHAARMPDTRARETYIDTVRRSSSAFLEREAGRAEDPYGWRVRIADREPRELDA